MGCSCRYPEELKDFWPMDCSVVDRRESFSDVDSSGVCAWISGLFSDSAEYLYKTTGYYDRSSERGIAWNDPDIGIAWPQLDTAFSLSEKDRNQPAFKQAELFD